jgi:competence protein ComEA
LIVQAGKTKLSLNAAHTSDFEDLPGIGPILAERIVDYREKEGGYESLEELKRVKGIGDNLYQKIVPYIRL